MAETTSFKFAGIQLAVTADKEQNLSNARERIKEAVGQGAQIVALPVCYYLSLNRSWSKLSWCTEPTNQITAKQATHEYSTKYTSKLKSTLNAAATSATNED
jgi:hypothetical protein